MVQQIACGHAGQSIPARMCVLPAPNSVCPPLQLILTERGATKVHGKISFIDLAGSERGADTCAQPPHPHPIPIPSPCMRMVRVHDVMPGLCLRWRFCFFFAEAEAGTDSWALATTTTKKRGWRGQRSTNHCWHSKSVLCRNLRSFFWL